MWVAVLLALPLARGAAAQGPALLVSLSGDDALASGPVLDQELVFHAPGGVAHVAWPSATLALMHGDLDGGLPLHTVLNDVDAVHLGTGSETAGYDLFVSMPTDQDGYLDGDIVRYGPLGPSTYLPESWFVTITGASDGNVDVDAFHEDPDGTQIFSFADNETSVALSGDDPGVIKDGDVMVWVPGAALATMLHTEAEIDAMVGQALGASTSTTDTTGVARDPATGALLFSTLSPTADDATVFTTANGGARLAGHEEASFGFLGSPELDGLTVATWRFPSLTVSDDRPGAGDVVTCALADAQPGRPYVMLASMGSVFPTDDADGWGGFVLQQDPLLVLTWSIASSLVVIPGAQGEGQLDLSVPVAAAALDVVLQAVAPGALPDASNPLVIELLQ